MVNANCPSCGSSVLVSLKPRMGQRLTCKKCATELEVVWLDPVELDWPYDEDEFEDDEDDWADDD